MTQKAVSILLSILMIVTLVPFGALSVSAASESGLVKIESDVVTDYGHLGWTFNALSNDRMDDITNLKGPIDIFDYSKLEAYVIGDADKGVLSQGATVEFASSAKEMMQKLGIETSSSAKGKVGISKAKVGFESKFSTELDYTTESKVEELFYYYVYRAVCENYRLKTSSSYSNYLSDDFITVINNINPNNASSIKNFFDTYGTHVLIQYDKGAQMSLTAAAVSMSTDVKLKTSLSASMSASANIGGKASAEAANKFVLELKEEAKNKSVKAQTKWYTNGGDKAFFSNFSGDSISVNEQVVENWIGSINGENTVFLPETSKWVAIWEVIPNTEEYAVLRKSLYDYYVEQEITYNTGFFSRYISYSEFTDGTIATYVNPDGYVSFVTYEANKAVAPGSIIKVPITGVESYELVEYKVMSGSAEVDRNGVVQIQPNATDKVIVQVYGDYLPIATLSFSVVSEGNNGMFAGGYGTEERPYLISNATNLTNIRNCCSANDYFSQTNNISLNGGVWAPIPTFNATYDGNGFSISDFSITSANNNKAGFVAVNTGTIKNLTLSNATIQYSITEGSSQTSVYVGAIAGENQNVIEYCNVNNTKIYGQLNDNDNNAHAFCNVGGIAGRQTSNGKVSYCSVDTCDIDVYMGKKVDAGDNNYGTAGGIVGACYGTIEYAISKSNDIYSAVLGDGKSGNKAYPETVAGGIAGAVSNTAKINNCIAYSNTVDTYSESGKYTTPSYYEGEIVGYLYGSLTDCYCNVNKNLANVLSGGTTSNVAFVSSADLPARMQSNKNWVFDSQNVPSLNSINKIIIDEKLKIEYVLGDMMDLSTLSITTIGNSDIQYKTPQIRLQTSMDVMNSVGTKEILISVGSLNTTFSVNVLPVTLQKIEITQKPAQIEYYIGDTAFNTAGLNVEASYNNGERKNVTDLVVISGFDTSVATENKTILLTYSESGSTYTTEQKISVSDVVPFKIEMDTLPQKTNYVEGETFDGTGCRVKVYYNNGATQIASENLSYDGFNSNLTGTQSVTVKYSDSKILESLTTTFEVNVGTIQSIAIKTMPSKTQYYVGDAKKGIDATGLVLTATYSNGVTVDVNSGFSISNLNASTANTWETVTVSLFGKQTTFQVYINPVELVSIEIDRLPQTAYFVGDTFSSVGLRIKAIYNNGDVKLKQGTACELLVGNIDANNYTFTSAGSKSVTVDYYEGSKNATTSFDVSAVAVKLDRLEIAKQPTKIAYKAGESIDTTGMIVNVIYNNGDVVDVTNSIDSIICDLTTVGEKEATVWYNNINTSFEITVMSPSHISVTTLPTKTVYNYGEDFDYTGMVVTAYYPDGSQKTLEAQEYSIETTQNGTDGNVMITVDYLSRNDFFYVTVLMPTIDVDIVSACAGKTATVAISINNSPGILGASFEVSYDEKLTLLSVESGEALSTLAYTAPGTLTNPCSFGWDGIDIADKTNGVVLTLTFKVPDDAKIGDSYEINVSYDNGSIFDEKMQALNFDIVSGSIEILDYTSGDLNDDGVINMQDVVLLRRYIVGGYDVDINTMAADVNRDDTLNMQDVVLIRRYIVGGYGVELQ